MEDSIYETYNKCEFLLRDDSGELQEYLMTVEGVNYELSMGMEGEYITSPFIVKDDILEKMETSGLLTGVVRINLVHEFKGYQEIASKYYSDKISNIVSSVKGSYSFASSNIDTTGNNCDWYQLLKNQVDFVRENLLPFAYSSTYSKSPFFFFIDNKNQYNFKSFGSMMKSAVPIELTLTAGTAQGSTNKSILDIKRLRKGMNTTYDLRHRRLFYFSDSSTTMNEDEDYIYDYPQTVNSIPIIADSTLSTSYYIKNTDTDDVVCRENVKGLLNYSMINSMTLDRFIITMPFNPEIVAGIPVSLVIPTADNGTDSYNFTGTYLVEKSLHSWNGESSTGVTHAVIGRKSTVLPSNLYKLKEKLING